jgi:hypothetical protein
MSCPRSFAIATHGLCGPTKLPMEIGSFGHAMIETKGDIFDDYKMDKIVTTEQMEQTRAFVKAITPLYFERYEKEDKKWELIPEHVFDVDINGVRFRGKIDGVMACGDELALKEIKFKSRISEDILDNSLALDWQSLCYIIATMLETKNTPQKVLYDVIRYPTFKPGLKPVDIFEAVSKGVKKEPEHWFKRWWTKYSKDDVMVFMAEFKQKVDELKERKLWYRNECNCTNGFFACEYLELCTTGKITSLVKKKLFNELDV